MAVENSIYHQLLEESMEVAMVEAVTEVVMEVVTGVATVEEGEVDMDVAMSLLLLKNLQKIWKDHHFNCL